MRYEDSYFARTTGNEGIYEGHEHNSSRVYVGNTNKQPVRKLLLPTLAWPMTQNFQPPNLAQGVKS